MTWYWWAFFYFMFGAFLVGFLSESKKGETTILFFWPLIFAVALGIAIEKVLTKFKN